VWWNLEMLHQFHPDRFAAAARYVAALMDGRTTASRQAKTKGGR
jgi:hypothetical protein